MTDHFQQLHDKTMRGEPLAAEEEVVTSQLLLNNHRKRKRFNPHKHSERAS